MPHVVALSLAVILDIIVTERAEFDLNEDSLEDGTYDDETGEYDFSKLLGKKFINE